MIEFEKIEFRNFLSYGNTPTTWEFAPGVITRIAGENGAGKSSCVVDVLYFGLFGKTYRKQKMEQIVNWVNRKNLEVTVWFTIKSDKYRIERGLKPSFLRVYKEEQGDYELIPVMSSSRDYQKIIEEDILQMNESVFNQTVIKSMTKNLSFMNLSKREKRDVVESILGIEVFTHMNYLTKHKLYDLKSEIEVMIEKITANKSLIFAEQNNLESLKLIREKVKVESANRVADLNKSIEEAEEKYKDFFQASKKLKKYLVKEKDLKSEIKKINDLLNLQKKAKKELETDILFSDRKIKMFEETCPGCPKIKEMKHDDSLVKKKAQIRVLDLEIDSYKDQQEELKNSLNKTQKLLVNETFVNNSLNSLKNEIIKLRADIDKTKEAKELILIDETNLKKLLKQRATLDRKYDKLNKAKRHLIIMKSLLSDDGIKTFIIKRYLPHINKLLNTYLQKFNTNILFYFDAEFNDVIGSRYKEGSSYNCFSEGQKRRIDLSVLFTFIDFSQMKNRKSNTNLLVLDEITTGVDLFGENILFDILKDISVKENKEIITISHSGNIDPEKIDRLFEVSTVNGFSEIELIES